MAVNERWTHRVVKVKPGFFGIDAERVQAVLDQHGSQGWEFVQALQPHPLHAITLFFKRPN